MFLIKVLAPTLLALLALSCTDPQSSDPAPVEPPHVVVISIDGLRPDAIDGEHMPALSQLISQGASSLVAETVLPSLTLPAHTSMLTGLVPQRHGITWNDDDTTISRPLTVATVFDVLATAGVRTALFAGKGKLRALTVAGAPTYLSAPPGNGAWNAAQVVEELRTYLLSRTPVAQLIVVHLPDADYAGHGNGWMTSGYFDGVRKADLAFGQVWDMVREKLGSNLIVIVTADHGGIERGHGDASQQSMRIPFLVWGRGVRNEALAGSIRVVDVAPTVLSLLRVTVPTGLDGHVLTSPFTSASLRASQVSAESAR